MTVTKHYVDAEGRYLGTIEFPSDTDIAAPEGGIEAETAPADARQIWQDGAWSDPPEPAPTPAELKAYLAARRYDAETGGITVDTMEIATDRDSQGKILAAHVKAAADPEFSTTWKAMNGWFSLDAAAIVALSDAVLAHVAACFAAEETVSAAIDTGEVTTRDEAAASFTVLF